MAEKPWGFGMPWKEVDLMSIRTEFVLESFKEECSFSELCTFYGISPKTGYKWVKRFEEEGKGGLINRSRRPKHSPNQLSEDEICGLIRLKQAHMGWGPYKIRQLYEENNGKAPSESSVKRVLDKVGLVQHRRRRPKREGERIQSPIKPERPNQVWTVDFKGWWFVPSRQRCEPLTVRDEFSRYIIAVRAMNRTTSTAVRQEFEGIFTEYGLPEIIRSDNGAPFAAHGSPCGLSKLSAWWVSLGIGLDRIKPGCPQQNGGHERMHRDIKWELQRYSRNSLLEQQQAFDIWRDEFNHIRPHEHWGQKPPARFYEKSKIGFEGSPDHIIYPDEFIARKVSNVGIIKIQNKRICLTTALRGYDVGLKFLTPITMEVHFDYLNIGTIDLEARAFKHADPHA
jgi:transposase InsO family protein